MQELHCPAVLQSRSWIGVIRRLIFDQGLPGQIGSMPSWPTIRRRGPIIEYERGGVRLGQSQKAVRLKKRRDDPSPSRQIGQPDQGAPTDEDAIKGTRLRQPSPGIGK